MTTTVTVRARGLKASVSVSRATEGEEGHKIDSEDFEISPHNSQSFHLDAGQTLTVSEQSIENHQTEEAERRDQEAAAPAVDPVHPELDPKNVPGREQNDTLIGADKGKKARKADKDDADPENWS